MLAQVTAKYTPVGEIILPGSCDDSIYAGFGQDTIDGGSVNDTIYSDNGVNQVLGDARMI